MHASYGILLCSNVFYNIFYICNEVLMWYTNIFILIEHVSYVRSFNRRNVQMREQRLAWRSEIFNFKEMSYSSFWYAILC